MPDRIYRPARPEDAAAIPRILMEGNLSPLSSDGVFTALCEERGKPLGILRWRSLGHEAEILDVAVALANRRTGCAAFLLRNFLQQMTASGVRQIFLEVRESNTAAISLYEKFGFAPSGHRPKYYRNPDEAALLMKFTVVPS